MKSFKNIYRNFGICLVSIIPLSTALACSSSPSISQEQRDVQDVQSILDKFKDSKTKNNKILPTENELKNITLDLLDIDNPISDDLGTKITFSLDIISKNHDAITIEVTVTKNQAQLSKKIKIKGFKVIINQDEIDVDFILKAFKREQKTNLANYFPDWEVNDKMKAKDLGITEPNNPDNVTLEYKILGISHDIGKIYVEVKAQKSDIIKSFPIIIDKFLKKVDLFDKLFSPIKKHSKTNLKDAFPSIISRYIGDDGIITDAKNLLGIEPITLQKNEKIKIEYKLKTIDDTKGIIKIEIDFTLDEKYFLIDNENAFLKGEEEGWNEIISTIETFELDVTGFKSL